VFAHLQVHSAYSLLYGTRPVEDLVRAAAGAGFEALALTDINNLYGVHAFIEACGRHGLRPIIGAEIRHLGERAVLLCRDRTGFSNLCLLITRRMREESFDLSSELVRHREGLFVLTDSPGVLSRTAGEIADLYGLVTPFGRTILPLAAELGVPVAAAGDASFLAPEDRKIHRILRAVSLKTSLSGVAEEDCAPPGALLFSPAEAERIFAENPETLLNTEKVAAACGFDTIFRGFIFPKWTARDPGSPVRESGEQLEDLTLRGARARYGENPSKTVLDRIAYELSIINGKGFTDYFLVTADIVKLTSRTCGRGSAAASVVSYCLGITNVDPIAYNLYFERFLNPDRRDPPDIDVDFAWDERDGIIAEVMRRYGEENSARICNHNRFGERGALREAARVYGIPDAETSAFEKRLDRGGAEEKDPVWTEILDAARRMTGLPKGLGLHSGGLVLTPGPIASYVPVETAAKGVPAITWEKDGTEEAGLVKIDLLGNRSLAVIRDALANLRDNGILIDEAVWKPQEDPATIALLARGDTMGVFYVESPAMRQLQKKTGAGDFEHLVIHSSIIRPAANRYINEYVRRLKGGAWEPLHPLLDPLLSETYGIMCYQEDVSKAAVAVAGFSHAEADGLRKILSKKNKEAKLAEYRKKFFEGSLAKGIGPGTIEKIWTMVLSFDGYSFCKPHSASYAMVAFQSAYLKAHHPAEFMAAVISNQGGYYTASAYISEAKRMGLRVLLPCVNEGRYRYTGRGGAVRIGFMAVAGLRRETAELITKERSSGGPFSSVENFAARMVLLGEDPEALTAAGALDSVAGGRNRAEQLWTLLRTGAAKSYARDLFAELPPSSPAVRPSSERVKPPGERETAEGEYRRLGFLHDKDCLWFRRDRIAPFSRVLGKDLGRHVGKRVLLAGRLVTVKEIITIQGKPMEFVSFEDETAIYETVFFPEVYRRYAPLLDDTAPFWVRGRVENDMGAISLHVEEIKKILIPRDSR
jgi:DNA polymerase-3 subunit alpha/error-prone DNA polymerase